MSSFEVWRVKTEKANKINENWINYVVFFFFSTSSSRFFSFSISFFFLFGHKFVYLLIFSLQLHIVLHTFSMKKKEEKNAFIRKEMKRCVLLMSGWINQSLSINVSFKWDNIINTMRLSRFSLFHVKWDD